MRLNSNDQQVTKEDLLAFRLIYPKAKKRILYSSINNLKIVLNIMINPY